jgi:hypothetical protein
LCTELHITNSLSQSFCSSCREFDSPSWKHTWTSKPDQCRIVVHPHDSHVAALSRSSNRNRVSAAELLDTHESQTRDIVHHRDMRDICSYPVCVSTVCAESYHFCEAGDIAEGGMAYLLASRSTKGGNPSNSIHVPSH